jgi:hypothetical protein
MDNDTKGWRPFEVMSAARWLGGQGDWYERYYHVVMCIPGIPKQSLFEGDLSDCSRRARELNEGMAASLAQYIQNSS